MVQSLGKRLAAMARKPVLRVIGLMSGTSADGVDAAAVDVSRRGAKLQAFTTVPYAAALRRRVLAAFEPDAKTEHVCLLNTALGEAFAAAALKLLTESGIDASSVDAVGSHGQTVRHLPAARRIGPYRVRSTLQIGSPAVIAQRTHLPVVADFRAADVAAAGQGAPLVPFADHFLFAHKTRTRAVQNIGGIANVTFLPAGGGLDEVVAFDTGPGNMILDQLVRLVTGGRRTFDKDGRMARRGSVHERLLDEWLRHPFLRRRPPKTAGREQFGRAFAEKLRVAARRRRMSGADLLATATALTAGSIADAYRRFLPHKIDEVILCGGGAQNRVMVGMLRERLPDVTFTSTGDYGIDADAKEAVSFAVLAAATIRGTASNVPAATGARREVMLGSITPPA